MMMMMIMRQI